MAWIRTQLVEAVVPPSGARAGALDLDSVAAAPLAELAEARAEAPLAEVPLEEERAEKELAEELQSWNCCRCRASRRAGDAQRHLHHLAWNLGQT
jgi:hypothetical protein